MNNSAKMRERRAIAIQKGICQVCLNNKAKEGRSTCSSCIEKAIKRNKRLMSENDKYIEYARTAVLKSQKKRRSEAVQKGICPRCCKNPVEEGNKSCKECRDYRAKEREKKKEQRKGFPDRKWNDEEWKYIDVVSDKQKYMVSSYGRIWSIYRNRELKASETKEGYLQIRLSINGKTKILFVHRLVAIAFISNPENKIVVNHKDGNKKNNHITNLEWTTHLENVRHAINTGLTKVHKVLAIESNEIYPSARRFAEIHKVHQQSVYAAIRQGTRIKGNHIKLID